MKFWTSFPRNFLAREGDTPSLRDTRPRMAPPALFGVQDLEACEQPKRLNNGVTIILTNR